MTCAFFISVILLTEWPKFKAKVGVLNSVLEHLVASTTPFTTESNDPGLRNVAVKTCCLEFSTGPFSSFYDTFHHRIKWPWLEKCRCQSIGFSIAPVTGQRNNRLSTCNTNVKKVRCYISHIFPEAPSKRRFLQNLIPGHISSARNHILTISHRPAQAFFQFWS